MVKRILSHLEETALYVVILFLIGILIAKIFGHLTVDDTLTQVITIVQIFASIVLAWIAGWKKGSDK